MPGETATKPVYGDDPLDQVEGQLRRRRTLEAIKRLVLRESVNQPLLVICEDLHWIDAETQALLNLLADSIGTAKILLLVNYRPEYTHGWGSKTYYTQARLDPLGRESAEEMFWAVLGVGARHAVPLQELANLVIERTEGNPFFMEEIVQSLFEVGALVRNGTVKLVKPLESLRIPPTVQGILASRIDRLPPEQKELLQTLAVLGKEFGFNLVRAVTARGDEDVSRQLGELQLAEFIYEQPAAGDVEYTFKHALTQEVAYQSVLSDRRQLLHERAAQAIEALGPARVKDHLMEVAHHYNRSGNLPKAVEYLGRAGQRAARQAAHAEAEGYLTRALELLPQLPKSAERARQELELGQALAFVLAVTKGHAAPDALAAAERVAVLADQSATLTQLVDSVLSRCAVTLNSGDLPGAITLAEQGLELAVRERSPVRLGVAHHLQALTHFYSGDLGGAEEHITGVLPFINDPVFRQLPGLAQIVLFFASWNAWLLGQADMTRHRMAQARAAADPNDPYDLAYSEVCAALLRSELREYEHAEVLAAQALACAENHHFPFLTAVSRCILGQARAQRGGTVEGIALIREGIAGFLETGPRLETAFWTGVLAQAQAWAGAVSDALATIEQALQMNPDARVWQPEHLRLRGTLRLTQGQTELAEADFREAIALAQQMGAKTYELRATMSLARLLAQQGHHDQARTMLAEIYNQFTEGFDTVDLKEAKALLEELGG